MDAHDVFKKLTKFCKFARPKTNAKEPELKVGELKEDKQGLEISLKDEKEENTPVTLFSSHDDTEPRAKKRKRDDPADEARKQKLLRIEEINHYRNVNHISVVGKKVPDPARSFGDFEVKPGIIQNLRDAGYIMPTPVQQQAVPVMLEGRNLLACAPTGSGKTAAFLVPIIQHLKGPKSRGFRALVLCPTRELAKQTQQECLRLADGRNLRIHVISKIKKALTMYGPENPQKFDILITTPNRLCFLLKQDPPAISLANIKWLIIDEADKLFETGTRSFREQMDQILKACTNESKKIAMFSATHTPVVAKWCVHNMKNLVRVTIGQRNSATDSVNQKLTYVGTEHGKLIEIRKLIKKGMAPPVLIFVQSKERAQQLFQELVYEGIMVDVIHSDRTQTERDHIVKCFREQSIWVLICTELMARGIDFKGVNLVINYDFPPSLISYVHRVGRAGRAGRKGEAITFWTNQDQDNLRSIAHIIKASGGEVPEFIFGLKQKSRKDKKKFKNFAPERESIDTRPKHKPGKRFRKRGKKEGSAEEAKSPD